VTQRFFERVKAELPAGVPFRLGSRFLAENTPPPRLVLVPDTDTFTNPDNRAINPDRVDEPPRVSLPPYTRLAGFVLHIWGRDFDEVEVLLNSAIAALRKVAGSSLELRPSGWNDEESELKSKHLKYELNLTVLLEAGSNPDPEALARVQRIAIDEKDVLP
jgi:hypothetical protein